MTNTHDVQFVKTLRECPHNARIVESGSKKGLLYDYHVLQEGELKAIFSKLAYSTGYTLLDPARRAIHRPSLRGKPNDIEAKQKDFADVYASAEKDGLIPTKKRLAEMQAERLADAKKRAEEKAKAELADRMRQAGPELFASLKAALAVIETLMPGVKYIPIQDYAALNDVPLACKNLIDRIETPPTEGE